MNAVRSMVRAFRINSRAIERRMGMSLAQLFVLEQLFDHPATSLNELAQRTATHQSSVSVVVRRLVERGFVERHASPSDRRRLELTLTAAGAEVLSAAPQTVQSQLLRALAALPNSDRVLLANLLERWIGSAGIDMVEPPMLHEDGEPPTAP